MKKIKQIGCTLVVFALVVSLFSFTNHFSNSKEEGKCGENVQWTLKKGILTIFGTGEMYNYDMNSEETTSPFINHSDIEQVIIEEGVTNIGDYAFYNCSNLKTVTLNEGLEIVGQHAFGLDEGIVELSLPATVTSIGAYAFERCSNLEYLAIPDGVTILKEGTFYRCKRLYSVNLSNHLEIIEDHAFMQCLNLRSVILPVTLQSIGKEAFSTCTYLEEICIPELVTTIASDAFNLSYNVEVVGKQGSYAEEYSFKHDLVFYSTVSDEFIDVADGLWFSDLVIEVSKLGYMTGTTKDTFGPYESVTRGMAAVIIYRIIDSPKVEYKEYFSDVDETKYYAKAITYEAQNGIINTDNDQFNPTDKITRESFCVMCQNLLNFLKIDTSSDLDLTDYSDYQNISEYAKNAVKWALENNLLYMEDGDTSIHPKRTLSRAECAMMVLGIGNLINDTDSENVGETQ